MDHARVWLAQGRVDLAQQALRRALTEDPENSLAHALLSLCLAHLERAVEAVHEAREAIRTAPDASAGHYALGVAQLARGELDDARRALGEALRIDPRDAASWAVLGSVELGGRRWAAALEAADRALAIDPEHLGAANVRATALGQLGRGGEAHEELSRALGHDPENATTHVTAGWRWLAQGQPAKAAEHFLEALRLAPDDENARRGILEALKARNRFYRAMLGWFLWLSKQSTRTVWIVVIAVFVLPRGLRVLAKSNPALAPWVTPLIVLVAVFVYLTWIIGPLFDASLFLHPLGRNALSREERRRALAVTLCLGAGLVGGLVAVLWLRPLLPPAILSLSFVIPLSACLGVDGPRRRRIARWALAAMGLLAVVAAVTGAAGIATGEERWFLAAAPFFMLYFVGVLLTTFVAMRWGLDPKTE